MNISDITAGQTRNLSGTVVPNNATNQTITWSIENAGTTGATITSGNMLNTTTAGTVTVRATITNGATATTNFTQDFNITVTAAPPVFVAVTNITGVNISNITAGQTRTLSGTVAPNNATNQTITWSVQNAGGTGSTITGGNTLNTLTAGTVTVRATITNGATATTNYTQDFNITVVAPTFTVTMTNDGNGTATANPATGAAGTEVTITATPNSADYHFLNWVVVSGGVALSSTTVSPATFTMPANNVEIRAGFERTPLGNLNYDADRINGTQPPFSHPTGVPQVMLVDLSPLSSGVYISNVTLVSTTVAFGFMTQYTVQNDNVEIMIGAGQPTSLSGAHVFAVTLASTGTSATRTVQITVVTT